MRSITVVSDNRHGVLADISYVLGKSGIDIDGLNVDVVGDKAVIAMGFKDAKRAGEVLEQNGFKTANAEAIIVKGSHNEALLEIARTLEHGKVRVRRLLTLCSDTGNYIFAINVDKPRRAFRLLDHYVVNRFSGHS